MTVLWLLLFFFTSHDFFSQVQLLGKATRLAQPENLGALALVYFSLIRRSNGWFTLNKQQGSHNGEV